jgi:hypothetical protein
MQPAAWLPAQLMMICNKNAAGYKKRFATKRRSNIYHNIIKPRNRR